MRHETTREQAIWKIPHLELTNTSGTSRIPQMTKEEASRRRTKSINGTKNSKKIFISTLEIVILTVIREKRRNLRHRP
jgi:hypothetical protein